MFIMVTSFPKEPLLSPISGMYAASNSFHGIIHRQTRAITHDPEIYPDPDVFDPNRYLGEQPQMDPFKFVFGFGRRGCPGKVPTSSLLLST